MRDRENVWPNERIEGFADAVLIVLIMWISSRTEWWSSKTTKSLSDYNKQEPDLLNAWIGRKEAPPGTFPLRLSCLIPTPQLQPSPVQPSQNILDTSVPMVPLCWTLTWGLSNLPSFYFILWTELDFVFRTVVQGQIFNQSRLLWIPIIWKTVS